MRDIDQKIFNFSNDKNFKDDDFYLSNSNRHIYKIGKLAKMGKKFFKYC